MSFSFIFCVKWSVFRSYKFPENQDGGLLVQPRWRTAGSGDQNQDGGLTLLVSCLSSEKRTLKDDFHNFNQLFMIKPFDIFDHRTLMDVNNRGTDR